MYSAFEKSFEAYYQKVMLESCTLYDWKNFRLLHQKMPRISHSGIKDGKIPGIEIRKYWKYCDQFANAAKHVDARLKLDDIAKDPLLEFAYHELFHVE